MKKEYAAICTIILCFIIITTNCNAIITSENYFNVEESAQKNNDSSPACLVGLWPKFPEHYENFFEVEQITAETKSPYGVDCADFNNDGHLDFAINSNDLEDESGMYAKIDIYYWEDNEYFPVTAGNRLRYEGIGDISDLEVADFDGDGDIDILYTRSEYGGVGFSRTNGTGYILFNDGSNNFPTEEQVFWHSRETGQRYNPKVESADFDDDGDIDFIVGDNSGKVAFYTNDGDAHFTLICECDYPEYGGGISWGLANGDFDDDGDIDFIVTELSSVTGGSVVLQHNDGSPSCFNHSNYAAIASLNCGIYESFFIAAGPTATSSLCSLDYNDDGLMDFLVGQIGGLYMFVQKEDHTFQQHSVARLPMYPAPEGNPGEFVPGMLHEGGLAAGDLNNDGLTDVIAADVSWGEVRIFTNNKMLVDIIHPDCSQVFSNDLVFANLYTIPIYSMLKRSSSIVFGAPTVEVLELEPLSRVEFYLGNRLMHTDTEAPYEWEWDNFGFGRYHLKAVGYDLEGNNVGYDDSIVWKFFSRVP